MSIYRSEILSLYRRIFRLARTWNSGSNQLEHTRQEKEYMFTEARRLFKKNKYERSEDIIKERIREVETRIGLAQHYGNPYPRMMNIPQNVLAPHGVSRFKKAQKRAIEQAIPVYLKSFKDENLPDR